MNNYKLIDKKFIKEVNGDCLLLEHNKTKAKVFVVNNDDTNRAFSVSFRTPPKDDTGVAHILEHSVLCGSRKYPLKDPFVELAKGSFKTFLNAMTFPDKTMYPVASTNATELKNLMDVYLDAVFFPNIYQEKRIFEQEGWHYFLDDNGDINYNGVVYNEMKGACSDPEQILYQKIGNSLYKEHTYGFESGGEPEAIPSLSYEDFLGFHKKYYHPSNSYIFLYGENDYEAILEYIDEEYLSKFDYAKVDSNIKAVDVESSFTEKECAYNISSGENAEHKSYISYNYLLEKPTGIKALAFNILDYILLSSNGSILKEALVKTAMFEEVYSFYDNAYKQPFYSIVGKHTKAENKDKMLAVINKTLEGLVEHKIPVKKLESAINYFEFKYKEADFGIYPKGVIYSLNIMENWLYELDPFERLQFNEYFSELRKLAGNGYFEKLIKDYILDAKVKSVVILKGDKNYQKNLDVAMKKQLKDYKDSLSKEEIQEIVANNERLKEFGSRPDKKEDYEKIPLLELSDIDKKPRKIEYTVENIQDIEFVIRKGFTNNIVYAQMLFDLASFKFEDYKKISFLLSLLKKVDTEDHSYSDLIDEINLSTGGISFSISTIDEINEGRATKVSIQVEFKAFSNNVDKALELIKEIMFKSTFDDKERIKEVLLEQKARLTNGLVSSGHSTAIVRSLSYHTLSGKIGDLTYGVEYFKYIKSLCDDKVLEEEISKLKDLYKEIFTRDNLIALVNTDEKNVEMVVEKLVSLSDDFQLTGDYNVEEELIFSNLKEKIETFSKVNYNALSSNINDLGYAYDGAFRVAQTIINLDFLWKRIRVQGGAYGVFCDFKPNGNFYVATYRDPSVDKSYKVFEEISQYMREMNTDERELRKYIIGSLSKLDIPLSENAKGEKALFMYLSRISYEDLAKERHQILTVTNEKLQGFAKMIDELVKNGNICTVGSEEDLEKSKLLTTRLELLSS